MHSKIPSVAASLKINRFSNFGPTQRPDQWMKKIQTFKVIANAGGRRPLKS